MPSDIKIGISSCLLGNKVRYNGGHKLDRFLRDNLGQSDTLTYSYCKNNLTVLITYLPIGQC